MRCDCDTDQWGNGKRTVNRNYLKVMQTLPCLKWINNKNPLYSPGNAAQSYKPAWTGRGFGGEWIHVYVWRSPFTVHWKLLHCSSAIPQYKTVLVFKKIIIFFLSYLRSRIACERLSSKMPNQWGRICHGKNPRSWD